MTDYFNSICSGCPYRYALHLKNSDYNFRLTPLSKECNRSGTLIVLQSPGIEEWRNGAPLQPTTKRGGPAGVRILQSWERVNKSRVDFDISNAVQCFQGNIGERDLDVDSEAISHCKEWLRQDITTCNYTTIIAFGNIAINSCRSILNSFNHNIQFIPVLHPNGGLPKIVLDGLW